MSFTKAWFPSAPPRLNFTFLGCTGQNKTFPNSNPRILHTPKDFYNPPTSSYRNSSQKESLNHISRKSMHVYIVFNSRSLVQSSAASSLERHGHVQSQSKLVAAPVLAKSFSVESKQDLDEQSSCWNQRSREANLHHIESMNLEVLEPEWNLLERYW